MNFFWAFFLISSSFKIFEASASELELEYPVHIHELGDFVITRPILETFPGGTMEKICAPEPTAVSLLYFQKQGHMIFRPNFRILSTDLICKYFLERGILDLIHKAEPLNQIDRQFLQILRERMDKFNASFLEGIESNEYERILAFAVVFFRIFKAAYPGLRGVKLDRREIVELSLIAAGWFMHHDEEDLHDKDILLAECLNVYHPEYSNSPKRLPSFRLSLNELYLNGPKIVFEAALQLNWKRIQKRNCCLCDDLQASEQIYHFLNNREIFFKLLENVENINSAYTPAFQKFHVLLEMIKTDTFYPEVMLRPELKTLRISPWFQECFGGFYSEALYLAVKHFNAEAVEFLLNLDFEFYSDNSAIDSSDSDSDDSDCDSSSFSISQTDYSNLRTIFLSDSLDPLTFPTLLEFNFCGFGLNFIMRNFRDHFASVQRIVSFNNEIIESNFREIVGSPVKNQRRKRERSFSPTQNK